MGSAPPSVPQQRYQILERIGAGGMAEVFVARALGPHGFEKRVALKRIRPEYAQNPRFERRLIEEARLAVTLDHANIVPVFDCGWFGESLCVVMELVDGIDLSSMLYELRVRDQQVPVAIAIYMATEILEGLDFAHSRGVIHRDVSPSNILISKSGEVKLADFGIALAPGRPVPQSAADRIAGKWRFMSPEQTRGELLDGRSDIFSAGAVLFELFTGQRLFDGDDPRSVVQSVRSSEIPRPSTLRRDLPEELDALVASALERDPARRPQRPAVLVQRLSSLARAGSLHATGRDLASLVEELLPTEIMELPPCDMAGGEARIDDILLSGLRRRGPAREDWNTEETTGSVARRLSEEDAETPPPEPDTEPLAGAERDTATITLVMPLADRAVSGAAGDPESEAGEGPAPRMAPSVSVAETALSTDPAAISRSRSARSGRGGLVIAAIGFVVLIAWLVAHWARP